MHNLPNDFIVRMKSQLGSEFDQFLSSYDLPPMRALRVNTLKLSVNRFIELCPWRVRRSPTLSEGLILEEDVERIGSHPLHIAGAFYMQEPSAMSVIESAQIEPGMKVLDLCAAPGGKSGGIAARLQGKGLLVSNEIVRNRAVQLARNIERLGVTNAVVTNAHPDDIASALPCYFDRVVVDAPCSGEGMFRKDRTAIDEWSLEHVSACAIRQSAILESACRCVGIGGKLIYSTCTFSSEENEGVIDGFLDSHREFALESQKRIYPHQGFGEGHFVAVLSKIDEAYIKPSVETPSCIKQRQSKRSSGRKAGLPIASPNSEHLKSAEEFFMNTLDEMPDISALFNFSDRLLYCPFDYPQALFMLPILAFGVDVGEFNKGRLKPAHAFFMAAHGFGYKSSVELGGSDKLLAAFLRGETLDIGELDFSSAQRVCGYTAITVHSCPVGFGKAVDGIIKNHLPKGLLVNTKL